MGFVYYFSLSCLAAILLTTGFGHLVKFPVFRALLVEHQIAPIRIVTLVAIFVLAVEFVTGTIALLLIAGGLRTQFSSLLFAAGASAGIVFLVYVRHLLRRSTGATACGCSPLPSPLTPVAMLPAATLGLVSCAGLISALWPATNLSTALAGEHASVLYALPILSGVVFAGITILAPASMPAPLTTEEGG